MADEEIKTQGADIAGKILPEEAPTKFPAAPILPVPPPSTAPSPSIESEGSPFFGKLIPPKNATSLNPLPQEPSQTPSAPTILPWGKSKPLSAPTQERIRAEDKLHSGNIVSLLEEQISRAQNPGIIAPPLSGTRHTETPTQRSIREIGLKPRLQNEPLQKGEPSVLVQKPNEPPRLRTYAADMSEEIRKRGETLSTIISAERRKMGKGPVGNETEAKTELETREKTKNSLLSLGAVLLIFIGIIGMAVTFMLTRPQSVAPERISLIPVNYAELVVADTREQAATELAGLRQDTALRLGEMKEFILTGGGIPIAGPEVLTLLGAPNLLARNVRSVMVGIHAFDRNQPFILISVSAYDRAFEGMLAWEDTIGETLGAFFAPYRGSRDTRPTEPPSLTFRDRVYQNIDVRESSADWKILYAFPRRDLLLITTNESTLREVVTRLTLQSGN